MVSEKEVEVERFSSSQQETGDRATYVRDRLVHISRPSEEAYAQIQDELDRNGPSFVRRKPHGKHRSVGRTKGERNKNEMIRRGRKIPMSDCDAQEVAIGEFSFIAVDFGDTIRASAKIGRDTLNVENQEVNQCVLMHLVVGARWV